MKRVTSIFLAICFLIAFSACDVKNDTGIPNTKGQLDTDAEMGGSAGDDSDLMENIESAGNWGSNDDIEVDTDLIVDVRNSAECTYMSLNELLSYPTDILKARFLGMSTDKNGMCHYEFEVIESFRGLGLEKTITVDSLAADCYITDKDITFSTYDLKFDHDQSYLLLLQRWTSVYDDGYSFGFVSDSLIIPIGENGKSYLAPSDSLMYGSDLSNHLGSTEIEDKFDNGTFEQYAVNVSKGNPMVYGDDYIKSSDMSEVICGSEYILEIEVESVVSQSFSGDRETCICEVISVYKGSYAEKTSKIIFPADKIELGGIYIVAVNAGDSQVYLTMSSKNSIYSLDQKDEIIAILSEK